MTTPMFFLYLLIFQSFQEVFKFHLSAANFSRKLPSPPSPGSPATNKELTVLLRTASWGGATPMVDFQRHGDWKGEEYGAETFVVSLGSERFFRMDEGGKRNGPLFFLIQWKWRGEASMWGKSVLQTLLATSFMFRLKIAFGSLQKVTCIYTQSLRSFNGHCLQANNM